MPEIRTVWSGHELRGFQPLLQRWIEVNERLVREWSSWNDVPWWYGERASVGTLAAAAWFAGGIALEEYGSAKARKGPDGVRSPSHGRTALYITVWSQSFVVEAKQWWPDLEQDGEHHKDGLAERMTEARGDASDVHGEDETPIAAVFAAPRIWTKDGAIPSEHEELVRKWMNALDEDDNDYSACAIYFPTLALMARDKRGGGAWFYPGTALFLKREEPNEPGKDAL